MKDYDNFAKNSDMFSKWYGTISGKLFYSLWIAFLHGNVNTDY